MTRNCPNCGTPAGANQRFCRSCGAALPAPAPAVPAGQTPGSGGGFFKPPRTVIGAAVLLAIGAIAGAMLVISGGSDSGTGVVEAKSLLSPVEFDKSSQDLSGAIAELNKGQLAAAQTTST